MRKTVSVIIPCYNAEQWVGKQIAAVSAQLSADDELVLVDNRSTDGTRALLDAAAEVDPRVRVVSADQRAGVNHARNAGLAAARGELLLICDADDRIHPGWVDALRAALAEADLAGGVAIPVDDDGTRIGDDIALHTIFAGPAYPLGGNMGMRREVFESISGFDEAFVGGHDEADFAWRAAEAGFETCLAPDARLDYLQRPTLQGTVRQRRNFGRTSILLWTRHPSTAGLESISFKGATRAVLESLPAVWKIMRGDATQDQAAAWGWALGVLEGHLRYRILRQIPPPLTSASDEASPPAQR